MHRSQIRVVLIVGYYLVGLPFAEVKIVPSLLQYFLMSKRLYI
ncbi:hypothetical protein [Metabacillus niabensis]|nr:hypothetical protein [Metabacillus niabensis]